MGGFVAALAEALRQAPAKDKAALHQRKQEVARRLGVEVPPDNEVVPRLPPDVVAALGPLARTKPQRTASGVAVVAVMSSPAACPHGKCVFCPGGPEIGVPQSYTGHEPSTLRAIRFDYDPYRIVRNRLAQLEKNGHTIDKVDLVIQGGTFPAREASYQDWFLAGIYAGLNDGPGDGSWRREAEMAGLPATARQAILAETMKANETADCRAIGLTIETKPDWCLQPHIDRMLQQGATRVEIGLQSLDDAVLLATHRGHTLEESRRSMRLARDAGLKICVHMMPGLPRDAAHRVDQAADLEELRQLFADEDWRPDMLKIYPTLVVEDGDTPLLRWWREGTFTPLGTEDAADLVAAMKDHVPPWCRIQRIDRDIPTTHVVGGVQKSNLRQLAQQRRAAQGKDPCACIRCREAGRRPGTEPGRLTLVKRRYTASGGDEVFLSFEDPVADTIAAFARVRRTSDQAHRPEARGVAFLRELKVHGTALPLGATGGGLQHQGLGGRLLYEAEEQAFATWGVPRLLVVAGPGVKPYYRRHGYTDLGPYVQKEQRSWSN